MNALRQLMLIVGKDLRIEGRTRQTIGVVLVLGILIVSVLGLGLSGRPDLAKTATPAILWVAYLFAGVLCFEKTMALERQEGALAALLAAPVDRGVIYFAKLTANLILMAAVATVVTLVGILFFQFDLTPAPWGFAGVIALAMAGFAAIGTLFAALVSSTRLAGGLLALVVFPLVLPVVIASTRVLTALFEGGAIDGLGVGILVAFDAIFLVVSWLAFELVLEP